ncbi:DUF823 domain-containing adhesin [Aeromonas enteropelogenes]|uniref:adhesion domain-containing protein n=1 Tax=Aeromonas enteropelogenes TaxID=29489 RepID=UPI0031356795
MNTLKSPRITLAIIVPLLLSMEAGAITSINAVGPVAGRKPTVPTGLDTITSGPFTLGQSHSVTLSATEYDRDPTSLETRWCSTTTVADATCTPVVTHVASLTPNSATGVVGATISILTPAGLTQGSTYYLVTRAVTNRGYPESTKAGDWSAPVARVINGQAPTAADLVINGELKSNRVLSLAFAYDDVDGDVAGSHLYQWYRSDSATGEPSTLITGATSHQYKAASADVGKYLIAQVIPKSATGNPDTGSAISKVVSDAIAFGGCAYPQSLTVGDRTFACPITTTKATEMGVAYSGTVSHYGGTYARMNWSEAVAFCSGLGGGNRLPTKDELLALYTAHPNNLLSTDLSWPTGGYGYWSSTPTDSGTHYRVDLYYGNSGSGTDVFSYYASCVR